MNTPATRPNMGDRYDEPLLRDLPQVNNNPQGGCTMGNVRDCLLHRHRPMARLVGTLACDELRRAVMYLLKNPYSDDEGPVELAVRLSSKVRPEKRTMFSPAEVQSILRHYLRVRDRGDMQAGRDLRMTPAQLRVLGRV